MPDQKPPPSQPDPDRPVWVRAREDYKHALLIARGVWPTGTKDEILQPAAVTILIYFKELKHPRQAGGGGKGAGGGGQRPQQATAPIQCPACQGPMYDNRNDKKSPGSPDYRCKDKQCLDDSGRVTGVWLDKEGQPRVPKKKPQPARARVGERVDRDGRTDESFDDFPDALNGGDDDLPF